MSKIRKANSAHVSSIVTPLSMSYSPNFNSSGYYTGVNTNTGHGNLSGSVVGWTTSVSSYSGGMEDPRKPTSPYSQKMLERILEEGRFYKIRHEALTNYAHGSGSISWSVTGSFYERQVLFFGTEESDSGLKRFCFFDSCDGKCYKLTTFQIYFLDYIG